VVLAERFAGGPDRVQGVALGPSAVRRSLGSTDLDDPLAALLQQPGKASAEAARPLDRPQATAGQVRVAKSSSRR
jgi:hypothetical protein